MSALLHTRCFRHPQREAVARCLGCSRTFCRECVTEHGDRVLCSSCLAKEEEKVAGAIQGSRLLSLTQGFLGIAVAWFFFYLLGRSLLLLPTSFHEGTLFHGSASSDDEGD